MLLTINIAIMAQNSIESYAKDYQNKFWNIAKDQSLSQEQKQQQMEQSGTEFMQKMLNDPNTPEEVKATIRQSLEDMKQYKIEQAKEAEEEAKIKAEKAQYFKYTVDGKSYDGRYINGKPYVIFPAWTLDVVNAKETSLNSNLYKYSNTDELYTAKYACNTTSQLVRLEELINLCNSDKKALNMKEYYDGPKEFLTYDYKDGSIYVFMCSQASNYANLQELTQIAARNAGYTTYGDQAMAKKLCSMTECNNGNMTSHDNSRMYYQGTIGNETKKLRYSVLCQRSETKTYYDKNGKKVTRNLY